MKTVKIHISASLKNDPYGWSQARFAFCTKPDKSKEVSQVGALVGCREDLVDALRRRHNSKTNKKLDLLRTRLFTILRIPSNTSLTKAGLAQRKADLQMEASLKLLNHYERKHGWALTRLYKGNPGELIPTIKMGTPADMAPYIFPYMTVGSNKWMKSPHYLSLYALLLRLGRSGFSGKFENQTELNRVLARFTQRQTGDSSHLKACYKYLDILLANQDELLEKRKDIFKKKALANNDSGYSEGIRKLCRSTTADLRLRRKFTEICKRY